MKIRGLLKNAAVVATAAAIPGMAMAGTVEDSTSNVASNAQTAQVTINLLATVGGFMRLEVTDRGSTTLVAPTVGSANPQTGSVDFGTVDAAGNGAATGVSTAPGGGVDDQFYIAELNARVFYTGIQSVGLAISGNQPSGIAPPVAKWACDATALGNAGWGSVGYGNSLTSSPGTAGCHNFTGAGGTTLSTDVDIAYLVSQSTATGSYTTAYQFTATPTVL